MSQFLFLNFGLWFSMLLKGWGLGGVSIDIIQLFRENKKISMAVTSSQRQKILTINVNIFVESNNVLGSGRPKASLRKCKHLLF